MNGHSPARPRSRSNWWGAKFPSGIRSKIITAAAIFTIAAAPFTIFDSKTFDHPSVNVKSAEFVYIKGHQNKFSFWQHLDVENSGEKSGAVSISAVIINMTTRDSCKLNSNFYIQDNVSHEFSSLQIQGSGDSKNGYFQLTSNYANFSFLKPGVVYKLILTCPLLTKPWFFFFNTPINETYYFAMSEKDLNKINKDKSKANHYRSGVQVNLAKQ